MIVSGPTINAAELAKKFAIPTSIMCVADNGSGAYNQYRVRVTPFAFVVGNDGRIRAKGLCDNPMRLRSLLTASGLTTPPALLGGARPLPVV